MVTGLRPDMVVRERLVGKVPIRTAGRSARSVRGDAPSTCGLSPGEDAEVASDAPTRPVAHEA